MLGEELLFCFNYNHVNIIVRISINYIVMMALQGSTIGNSFWYDFTFSSLKKYWQFFHVNIHHANKFDCQISIKLDYSDTSLLTYSDYYENFKKCSFTQTQLLENRYLPKVLYTWTGPEPYRMLMPLYDSKRTMIFKNILKQFIVTAWCINVDW